MKVKFHYNFFFFLSPLSIVQWWQFFLLFTTSIPFLWCCELTFTTTVSECRLTSPLCLSISNWTKTKLSVYRLLTTWVPTAGLHTSSSEVFILNKKTGSSITCLGFRTLCDSVEKVRVSVGRRTQSIFVDNVGYTLLSGVSSTMWYRAMAYVKWTYSRSSRVSETIRDLKVMYDFVFLLILWAE